MSRRALVVYQHAPTPGAPGIYRHRTLLAGLVERGWEVDLVSTPVNYMTGVRDPRYARRPYVRETIDGIVHHWVWATDRIHASRTRRIANYGTFAAAALARASTLPRPDVILVSTPPLSVAALGPVLASRFRRPWVMEVRDPWPDAAAVTGWLREGSTLWRWIERADRRLTEGADAVVVPTPGLLGRELRQGGTLVRTVPGVVTETVPDPALREATRRAIGVDETACLFVYTGAVGMVNGLDLLVDAVGLADGRAPFAVAIVGDGSARRALEERLARTLDDRIHFVGAVDKGAIPGWLAAADVCLHLLRPDPSLECALPSKVLEYFGSHRPYITTAPGLPERLALASGGSFAPDVQALACEIGRWAAMTPSERRERGEAGFRFGTSAFGRDSVVSSLETLFEAAIERHAGSYGMPASCSRTASGAVDGEAGQPAGMSPASSRS